MTGVPAEPTTARGWATRRALLDAAEDVFGRDGFERASVSEITRTAGVAQGTFYVHFADKKAVFVALFHELSHMLREVLAKAAAGQANRLAAERHGLEVFFEFIAEHQNLYRLIREAEFVDESLYRWHYARLAEGYARGLAAAQAAGQIPDDIDPEVMSYCLMGIAHFVGMRWMVWEGGPPPADWFDNVFRFVARGMGTEEAG
jgi:AcrR family transcriptional regulator